MPFHEEVKDSITALGVIEAWVVLQGEEAQNTQNCFTNVCFGSFGELSEKQASASVADSIRQQPLSAGCQPGEEWKACIYRCLR
jgi:hypothetical protein